MLAVFLLLFILATSLSTTSLSTTSSLYEACREEKYMIEHCRGYEFIEGYIPSDDYHNDVNRFLNFIRVNSTYVCNDVMMLPLQNNRINLQYTSSSNTHHHHHYPHHFNTTHFLSMIRNKQLSIIGDSVGQQIFHAINAELYPYQSYEKSSDTNGTHSSYRNYSNTNIPILFNPPDYNAATKYYPDYNTTIFFCRDNTIQPYDYIDNAEFCSNTALYKSDIVLIASGAWDKPPLNFLDHHTYEEIMKIGLDTYEAKMMRIHDYILSGLDNERKLNDKIIHPLIIWR